MLLKKTMAVLASISLFAGFATAVSADYSDATVTAKISATTVKAGEEITIDYSYNTLENSNGGTIFIAYDATAFKAKEGTQSIKVGKKTYEFENYICQSALDAIADETHILYNMFGTFEWVDDKNFAPQFTESNMNQKNMVDAVGSDDVDCIKFVYGDSSYAVTTEDEAEDMYPVNTVGANFVANADIPDGEYVFAVYSYANDKAATLKNYEVKTFTVRVGEGKPTITYPFNGSKAVNFDANDKTYIKITKTNSDKVTNIFLPSGVKGTGSVYGLFKYTADGTEVVAGDEFTLDFVNSEAADVVVPVEQK